MTTSDDPVRVLLVTGSTRAGSTNTAALRTAAAADVPGVAAAVWERLVELPAFVPGDDDAEPHPALTDLRERIAAAGAVVFSTPEYAGTLPGSLKNALDWLVGSGELYGKPVAWVRIPVGRELVGPDGTVHDPAVRARLAEQLATLAGHVRTATG
jgi:chromate reductase, NAD(P)H dehydrogenase (quinone)